MMLRRNPCLFESQSVAQSHSKSNKRNSYCWYYCHGGCPWTRIIQLVSSNQKQNLFNCICWFKMLCQRRTVKLQLMSTELVNSVCRKVLYKIRRMSHHAGNVSRQNGGVAWSTSYTLHGDVFYGWRQPCATNLWNLIQYCRIRPSCNLLWFFL